MREKIIKMLQQVNIPSYFCEDTVQNYLDDLKDNSEDLIWSGDYGITKCTLLFANYNKVIKIPYNGKYDYKAYEDAIAQDVGADHTLEEFFYEFTGPENFDNIDRGWDYCELETMIYKLAEAEGLERYFAKEELIGWVGEYPIYEQLRVTPLESVEVTLDKEVKHSIRKKCESLKVQWLNPQWVQDFFRVYGEEEYQRLCSFLDRFEITDLHMGNIGYYHGKPILFDYSGYMN